MKYINIKFFVANGANDKNYYEHDSSSQTMGLSPQAFSPKKEGIDENHPWVTDDGFPLNPPRHCVGIVSFCALSGIPGFILNIRDMN